MADITDEELRSRVAQLRAWATSRIGYCRRMESELPPQLRLELAKVRAEQRALRAALEVLGFDSDGGTP